MRALPEIVVVAYGAPALLRETLAPLAGFAVTVVDNSSSPEVAAVAREVGAAYWDPGANLGFGAGVNHALARRRTPGADVLLLNPDAVVDPDAIRALQAAMHAEARIATVGPAQFDADGQRAQVSWPYPHPLEYVARMVRLERFLRERPRYVIGSVLLMNAEALASVGGFDEGFFLYAEEADWQYRAHQAGWRNVVRHDVTATHVGAGTSTDPVRREVFLQAGQERFLRKHYGVWGWRAARWAVVVGSLPRRVLLRGARRGAARDRGLLFRRGPVAVEATYRPRVPRAAGAADGGRA
ncbi:glycosyltransferase [Microbacterium marinilacus]|uniref:Glycosyltransferase family 2 protein n=1 Tax=Microbacterium marinilacus TaxID=415209 RepID=A0ABP7BP55_9MICO|nr:glycosyltransferase [Microbacterium marinilacus]MBY0690043.1 glycosyltransferase [Microbacterium marinilacus]